MGGYTPRKPLAGHLARDIEQAGASAYVWHDQELAAHADPAGWWRGLSRTLSLGALLLAVAGGIGLSLTQPQWWVTAVVVLCLTGGLLARRCKAVAWIASLVTITTVVGAEAPAALPWVAAGLALAWTLVRPRHRDASFLIAALLVLMATMGGLAEGDGWRRWLPVVAVLAAGLLGAYLGGFRQLPRPFVRVRAADMEATIPSPPSRLPLLVQVARRKQLENVPDDIRRKKLGGDGERRTGLMLLSLARGKGTKIVHDVVIPGADRANVDHLVLARSGLFVIDSKQFGRRDDPGEVVFDIGSGEIVHRSNKGSRSIESSLRTAAWAVQGIGKVVGVPATAVLAIHNASVAPGLGVERNGTVIEVMSSWDLMDRIDAGPRRLSMGQMATGRMGLARLRSALDGASPVVISPKGMDSSMKALVARHATRRSQVRADDAPTPLVTPSPQEPLVRRPARPTSRPAPSMASAPEVRRAPSVETQESAPPRAWNEPRGARAAVQPQPSAPVEPPHRHVLSAQDQVDARWEQMTHSEPAAPDDVTEDLRGIRRGTAILVVEFVDNDLVEHKAVAMTGPCRGERGTYLWFCSPEQWTIYSRTNRKVNVATISTSKVMARNQTGGGA